MNKTWSRAFHAVAFGVVSAMTAATAACAVDATGAGTATPTPTEPTAAAGSTEPSATDGTKRSDEAVRVVTTADACSKDACCLLATPPGGYPDDPVEDALTRLGCTPPAAYSESAGNTETWLYVDCPVRLDLLFVVGRYAGSPYDARFSTSDCLRPTVRPGHVIVEFDPTCDSCISSQL